MADQTNVQQNQVPNEPELSDLLALHKKDIFLGLNCHHIGTIKSFDPVKQIATATINYRRTYFKPDPSGGEYVPELVPYPVLLDCPVIFLGGGNGALTFPVAEGDECLVLINDRDIDNWFSGSSDSAVATPRLHSVADALILVGLRSLANVISDFNPDAVELRSIDGINKITVGASGADIVVTVGNQLTATFKNAGGVHIENNTGSFDFMDNADVAFDTGTVQGLFGDGGKVSFTNDVGELIAALSACLNALTTGTAGGYPFILPPAFATNLTTVQSFEE